MNVPFLLLLCLKDHIQNSIISLAEQLNCYLRCFYRIRPPEILPSTGKGHWTVKGTQCYPTCSNSNALRWLPLSWTEFTKHKPKLKSRNRHDTPEKQNLILNREQRNSRGKDFPHILPYSNYCISHVLGVHLSILCEMTSLLHLLPTNLLTGK